MAQNHEGKLELARAQSRQTSQPGPPKKTINFQGDPTGSSPKLTPQCLLKPQAVSTFAAPAALDPSKPREGSSLAQAKSGRLAAPSGLTMPPTRSNATAQHSQIHGRKVDSPKIYVKDDFSEGRPKTSAQAPRKTASTQPQLSSKGKSLIAKRQGFKLSAASGQLFSQTNSGGLTSKESVEGRRFEFRSEPPSSTSAHTIQFEGSIGNPPKTTSNAALTSNLLLSGGVSKYQHTRQNA